MTSSNQALSSALTVPIGKSTTRKQLPLGSHLCLLLYQRLTTFTRSSPGITFFAWSILTTLLVTARLNGTRCKFYVLRTFPRRNFPVLFYRVCFRGTGFLEIFVKLSRKLQRWMVNLFFSLLFYSNLGAASQITPFSCSLGYLLSGAQGTRKTHGPWEYEELTFWITTYFDFVVAKVASFLFESSIWLPDKPFETAFGSNSRLGFVNSVCTRFFFFCFLRNWELRQN